MLILCRGLHAHRYHRRCSARSSRRGLLTTGAPEELKRIKVFGRTITLEKIGATTAEAYRMKSCFHLATPADASWLNVRMWHGASPGGFAGKCLTCKLSIQWASHLRWLQGVIEKRSRGTSSQGADLSKSSTAAGCFGKSSQARRRTNVFKVTILQWKSPRHWHQGGTDAKSRVACPRKVVRGTRRRRGKLHQDDRCKFGERPSTLWRPVTSCTIILPVEKGSSSPASRRHRCEVSRRHSA